MKKIAKRKKKVVTSKAYQKAYDKKFKELQASSGSDHNYSDECICSACDTIFKEMLMFSINYPTTKRFLP